MTHHPAVYSDMVETKMRGLHWFIKRGLRLFCGLCRFTIFGLTQVLSILWNTKLKSLGTSDMF